MSRSYRKTPIFANAKAASEKKDKQAAHRARRARFRTALFSTANLDEFAFNEANIAHSNAWNMAKDGRRYRPVKTHRQGRSLRVLSAPAWIGRTLRAVHKVLGK